MRRRFVGPIVAVTVAAGLVVGGVATAEKPVTSVKGNVHTEFNGGFSPKTLSQKELTPISFWISGNLKTIDGAEVPPLKEFILEGDKNVSIDVKDVPVCESGIRSRWSTTAAVRKACRNSLVGSGKVEMNLHFPGPPVPVESKLLALKGGFEGGVTTLYLHAYVTVPVPAAIITTVKVKRVSKGRFGLRAVATIPKIAGGSGSVTFFKLRLKKGILSARCPDGHLDARGTAVLGSTPRTRLDLAVVRPCAGIRLRGSHE